jgi:hypothetical protein
MTSEIKKQTIGYIVGAFGFIAALAWNDAIKALIDRIYESGDGLVGQVLYAVIVTLIVVIITMYLLKYSGREEGK